MKNISIVIPAYNEEATISDVLFQAKEVMKKVEWEYEIIVVDDGSEDHTPEIARKNGVRLVSNPENRGYGTSIKRGIIEAKNEIILITDADGTYPTKEIPKILKEMGDYDMVIGARTGEKVRMPFFRRPVKFLLNCLASYLSEKRIPDLNSGLRAFDREIALKYFHILPPKFSFTTTITLAFLSDNYLVKYIPIDYHKRKGRSKIRPLRDTVSFIILIIRIITYFNPLKVFLPMSFIFFLMGLTIFFYSFFVFHKVMDITMVIILLASILTFFFGLIADLIVKRGVKD